MKRNVLVTCLVVWVALVGGCRKEPAERSPVVRYHGPDEDKTLVIVEAEDFTGELESPVKAADDPDASNGRCIRIEGGSGSPGTTNPATKAEYPARYGAAVYHVTVTESGVYRFWGRKFWEDGCGNSLTLIVNGRPPVTFGQDGSYGHWEWIAAPALFDLAAGTSVIEILNREDGVRLDKFLLTTNLDFVPQGKE